MNAWSNGSQLGRCSRLATIAVALAVALSVGFAVGVHAADPRLDEADQALQKADALLSASQAGIPSPQVQKKFDRNVGRAVELIDRARAHVQAAKAAVDAELGSAAGGLPSDGAARAGQQANGQQ